MENRKDVEELYELLVAVTSKLYEALGIVRMIGAIEIADDPGQRLHDLESATWAARAAENILNIIIDMTEQ